MRIPIACDFTLIRGKYLGRVFMVGLLWEGCRVRVGGGVVVVATDALMGDGNGAAISTRGQYDGPHLFGARLLGEWQAPGGVAALLLSRGGA